MTRKLFKHLLLGILALSLTVTGAAAAEKSLGMKQFSSVEEVANAITSYFPKVQGPVTAVQGDQLTIGIGRKEGLAAGSELSLWRSAAEIKHPVTGQVIGHTENEVGTMVVTAVTDTAATGEIRTKKLAPQPGDKARITPRKIPLAILPLRVERPDIVKALADRLQAGNRFSVVENEKVEMFLADKKQRDASLIRDMGKALGLEAVVTLEIYPSADNKYLVTAGLYYADDARMLDTIVAMLDLRTKADVLGEVKPFFAPVKENKNNISDLPFYARMIAAADFEGIGSLQYAFSDGSRVHLYRSETSGWHETWAEPAPPALEEVQIINLDAADINGNGRPELFVTVMRSKRIVSYVLEFRDGLYQRIAEIPGFLRVITYPGRGIVLLGMQFDPKAFYSGQPHQLVWAEGAYAAGPELRLPEGVGFYGFAFGSEGDSSPLLFSLDEKNKIVVYSGMTRIWKSEETYLSVGTLVTKPITGLDAALTRVEETDPSLKVRIPGRVLTLDINGDGREEVILPKNKGSILLGDYAKGELVGLGWTGARLEQRWNVDDPKGVVLDLQVVRLPGTPPQILTLIMKPGGLFRSDNFSVVTYPAQ